jgi:lysophospholipase L1-like esterase
MRKLTYTLVAGAMLCCAISCQTNLSENPITKGTADFSRYVAIGNSISAGYADGALSYEGQQSAFPIMLANQFKLAGGGDFKVPFLEKGGGNDGSGNPRRVLGYVMPCGSVTPSLSPVFDPAGSTALTNVSSMGPYHLIGVPGARAIDANQSLYGFLNPFLNRFCQTPGSSTMLSEAMRVNPSFFTLWLGNNDVLLYATGGAVQPTSIFSPSITDPNALRDSLTKIVDALVKKGAKGAIANVPDITALPYFTTVPWNGAVLDQATADTMNALYQSLSLNHITWKAGTNGFVITDSTAPGNMRQATNADYVLLTTPGDSLRCAGWGVNPLKPLGDQYVLDGQEALTVQAAVTQYNTSIANLATTYNLAFVDANAFLKRAKTGIMYNGVNHTTTFVSGGAFSLDGVHLTPRGNALIANEFIKSINLKYRSTIPQVNPLVYNSVIFP